jgi:hypothetical protein
MISRAGHSTAALPEGIYRARLPEELLRRRENAGEPELGLAAQPRDCSSSAYCLACLLPMDLPQARASW